MTAPSRPRKAPLLRGLDGVRSVGGPSRHRASRASRPAARRERGAKARGCGFGPPIVHRPKTAPARRTKRAGRRGTRSQAGTPRRPAEGTRTLDLLHGKQTLSARSYPLYPCISRTPAPPTHRRPSPVSSLLAGVLAPNRHRDAGASSRRDAPGPVPEQTGLDYDSGIESRQLRASTCQTPTRGPTIAAIPLARIWPVSLRSLQVLPVPPDRGYERSKAKGPLRRPSTKCRRRVRAVIVGCLEGADPERAGSARCAELGPGQTG